MGRNNLELGTWNALCQVCGFKYKAYELKKRWDGLMVCHKDWELRHPQDLIKVPEEDTSVPWTSPEPADEFIEPSYVGAGVGRQENSIPTGNFTTNNETI